MHLLAPPSLADARWGGAQAAADLEAAKADAEERVRLKAAELDDVARTEAKLAEELGVATAALEAEQAANAQLTSTAAGACHLPAVSDDACNPLKGCTADRVDALQGVVVVWPHS